MCKCTDAYHCVTRYMQDTPWVPQFTLGEPKEENTTAELCSKSSHISIDTVSVTSSKQLCVNTCTDAYHCVTCYMQDTAWAPWEEPTRHSATNSSSFPLDDSVTVSLKYLYKECHYVVMFHAGVAMDSSMHPGRTKGRPLKHHR